MRKPDSKNKEQRQKKKSRKEEQKRKAKEEIRELKAMKRAEIEEKLRKLKEATGDESVPLSVEDLEKDFDPADYDRRMQVRDIGIVKAVTHATLGDLRSRVL